MKRLSLLALVILASACGGDSTAPPASLVGTWTSPSAGQFFDQATIHISVDGNGILGGDWSLHTAGCTLSGNQCITSGFVTDGTHNGTDATIPFSRVTSCVTTMGVVTATLTAPNTLSGNFVRTVCGGANDPPAPISLTRQ